MKYRILSIKPFPFEIPNRNDKVFIDGKLSTVIKCYPHPDDKNTYPLQIDWKYRLSYKGEHLFSYICETKFVIHDDGIPFNNDELDKFINDIYLNVELGWEDQTRNTPLNGSTMPALVGANLDMARSLILRNYNRE